jgi:protein-L-isoaspartate(D-aspartate) O-methyltransferase
LSNGALGLPENAPFERIIVTCAAQRIPKALLEQLSDNGRMVVPVGGSFYARLLAFEKRGKKFVEEDLGCPCSFVPLVEG